MEVTAPRIAGAGTDPYPPPSSLISMRWKTTSPPLSVSSVGTATAGVRTPEVVTAETPASPR